jgi:molybdate/tungstate transport system substrate-binding protein
MTHGKVRARPLLLLSLVVTLATACRGGAQTSGTERPGIDRQKRQLTVFHAGSLSVPFQQIADRFMVEHPEVQVLLEAAGSRHCARKISDLGRRCDVMASADYTVIDELLIPDHALWNIRFATNEMAIVFGDHSRRRDEIDAGNWFEILLDPDVRFGRSDPDADPCGYRAVMTVQLAESHYGVEGLAGRLVAKDNRFIRPKETDLLPLLETRAIDYLFLYRSVAHQHGLRALRLPDEINLRNPELAEHYSAARVEVSGKNPGETIVKIGEPMVYGVTIPSHAADPELAIAFVRFLLDANQGMAIMERNGQPSIVPAFTDTYDRLPAVLKRYALPKTATEKAVGDVRP